MKVYFQAQGESFFYGISVRDKTVTFYWGPSANADLIGVSFTKYAHTHPEFLAMGYEKPTAIQSQDQKHFLFHPKGDPLRHLSHSHFVLNQDVTPTLLDFYLDCMTTLENDLKLRAKYFKQLSSPFAPYVVPTKRVTYLAAEDKKAFRQLLCLPQYPPEYTPYRSAIPFYAIPPYDMEIPSQYLPLTSSQQNAILQNKQEQEARTQNFTFGTALIAVACCCTYLYKTAGSEKKDNQKNSYTTRELKKFN